MKVFVLEGEGIARKENGKRRKGKHIYTYINKQNKQTKNTNNLYSAYMKCIYNTVN